MKNNIREFKIDLRTVEQGGKTYILEEDVVRVSNKIAEMERNEPTERIWDYLVKKLKPLKDNNKTAREVFNYISKLKTKEDEK